eukprot:TRINITY_DN314_c0_g1_i8.p1 TRINITY_DN314_c0_g1~~TRINITY_DN314_c0_g1_i8.p1  ORF type:complete len:288 (+),score=75.22 TRINITY_DN314_c0_g1_i8:142-1005(+)
MGKEFIEGWDLMQILGEGTFAEVKLLVNRSTGEACAVKEIDLPRAFLNKENDVRKEICVHKLLKHRNIVQCYGSRIDGSRQFIFLEYCSGGELFDRIEPDKGMPESQAQGYFNQLMAGVEYLHGRGVAHRDIKPENLLLTDNDVLKISDFGMATVFRHKGEERHLERRCGTRPYMAPEILLKSQYSAEPADIWSCGVVLVAMLAGELTLSRITTNTSSSFFLLLPSCRLKHPSAPMGSADPGSKGVYILERPGNQNRAMEPRGQSSSVPLEENPLSASLQTIYHGPD